MKVLRIFPSSEKGTGVIREKVPYKCKRNTYWRVKPLKCSHILASFWEIFEKISPSSERGTGVIMEKIPCQCKINKYILENYYTDKSVGLNYVNAVYVTEVLLAMG